MPVLVVDLPWSLALYFHEIKKKGSKNAFHGETDLLRFRFCYHILLGALKNGIITINSTRIGAIGTVRAKRWIQKTHLFRADEYICPTCGTSTVKPYKKCPSCGTALSSSKYDPSWVDEAEGLSALLDDDW